MPIQNPIAVYDAQDLQEVLDAKLDDSQAGPVGLDVLGALTKQGAREEIGVIVRQSPIIGTTRTNVALTTTKADTTLEATITLTNASSRILILVNQSYSITAVGNAGVALYLNRGAVEILDPNAVGSSGPVSAYKTEGSIFGVLPIMHIDTPGAIGPFTYKTRGRSFDAKGGDVQAVGSVQNGLSTIILLEVA